MSWGWGWRPYVSIAERRRRAAVAMTKMRKKGKSFAPVELAGREIASTFWGKAWCDNLESYSDFENRLPRGRSYVRNGSVLDLQIEAGKVKALVSGSSLYQIEIGIQALKPARWRRIRSECTGKIDSLVELLQGRLSRSVMEIMTRRKEGLFPTPAEITMKCTCPDWAEMCKHVAASLYGVGARLDQQPELLFVLRGVDHEKLISQAPAAGVKRAKSAPEKERLLAQESLSDIFGIELDTAPVAKPPREEAPVRKAARATTPSKTSGRTLREPAESPQTKPVKSASSRNSTRLSREGIERRSERMRKYWENRRKAHADSTPRRAKRASSKNSRRISRQEIERRSERMKKYWAEWRRARTSRSSTQTVDK